MERDREQVDSFDSADERALDELLGRARWPDMEPAAEQRLRETWRVSFAGPRSWYLVPTFAAAAALVVVVLGAWWLSRSGDLQEVAQRDEAVEHAQPVQPVIELTIVPRVAVREPTLYERLLVAPPLPRVASNRNPSATPVTVPAPESPPPDQVVLDPQHQRAIELLRSRDPRDHDRFVQLVLDPQSRDYALEALHEMGDPPVEALLRQLTNPHVDRRFAAARALGEVCRPDVVDHLWQMVARNVNRREALAALLECHDPQAGRYLARAADDPSLEAQLRVVRQQMREMF